MRVIHEFRRHPPGQVRWRVRRESTILVDVITRVQGPGAGGFLLKAYLLFGRHKRRDQAFRSRAMCRLNGLSHVVVLRSPDFPARLAQDKRMDSPPDAPPAPTARAHLDPQPALAL